ncbi:hypothetical protein ACU4GD_08355 [Cupriavidus basilensis]
MATNDASLPRRWQWEKDSLDRLGSASRPCARKRQACEQLLGQG